MKQGTLITRIIMLVLLVGILAYFGVYAWNALTGGTVTTTLTTQTYENRISVTGYFFRDETVLTDTATLIEVLPDEGEKVGLGDVVARLYYSSSAYARQQELDAAQSELESLQYILARTGESADTAALDESIVAAFTAIRYATASGDYSTLSSDADELRTQVFRRDYSYTGTDTLTAQIEQAQALVEQLSDYEDEAYTAVTASASGLFSGVLDGYEGVMNLDALENLTPEKLVALAGQKNETISGLGKIISGSGWYFACNVGEDDAQTLYEGLSLTLRFENAARDYSATLTQISEASDGVVTLVFYSGDYAAQLTALRCENVEIILDSATGFRVPKRAIRVDADGQTGIYRVSGTQAEWIDVNILWEEGDYYLIEQALSDSPTTLELATGLRQATTEIVRGENIHDGKVVSDSQ